MKCNNHELLFCFYSLHNRMRGSLCFVLVGYWQRVDQVIYCFMCYEIYLISMLVHHQISWRQFWVLTNGTWHWGENWMVNVISTSLKNRNLILDWGLDNCFPVPSAFICTVLSVSQIIQGEGSLLYACMWITCSHKCLQLIIRRGVLFPTLLTAVYYISICW